MARQVSRERASDVAAVAIAFRRPARNHLYNNLCRTTSVNWLTSRPSAVRKSASAHNASGRAPVRILVVSPVCSAETCPRTRLDRCVVPLSRSSLIESRTGALGIAECSKLASIMRYQTALQDSALSLLGLIAHTSSCYGPGRISSRRS